MTLSIVGIAASIVRESVAICQLYRFTITIGSAVHGIAVTVKGSPVVGNIGGRVSAVVMLTGEVVAVHGGVAVPG